jgi:large subunit ribosomal protein L15
MNKSILSLHTLAKITARGKKRLGRGYGSGKGGHTSGRGQKGQKSRRTIQWWFEGGQLPLVKRVPFLRGKGRLNPLKQKQVIIKTGQFNKLKSGSLINIDTLIHERMVSETDTKNRGVKILAGGLLKKKLTISGLKLSAGAKKEIEKAGGIIKSQ